MTDSFIGEIKILSFDFPPRAWAFCDGAVLQIAQNQALFSLLGTTFGGNGTTTFGLPDLRGRAMAGWGTPGVTLGQVTGEETHTLTTAEMPVHLHAAYGTSDAGTTPVAQGNVLANPGLNAYGQPNPAQPIAPETVGYAGRGLPHENMPPYLAVSFVVALAGIFPPPPN